MEISSYIADLSMSMSAAQVQQQVDISVLKNVMDIQETSVDALISAPSLDPAIGRTLDMSA